MGTLLIMFAIQKKGQFDRHVTLSIVATNLHRIGLLLQRKELARLRRLAA